ncbi:MAG: hypothetical protein HY238_07280, partial [Acidobacteria bacterium]|nr:hypothetical protein [Acidobacteriota bacterium]
RSNAVPRPVWDRAKADTVAFIRRHHRLPAAVWVASENLSLADFAATLAGEDPSASSVPVRRSNLELEKYFSTDPAGSFNWLIHPEGFQAPELLELGRQQGWTLKPARLR